MDNLFDIYLKNKFNKMIDDLIDITLIESQTFHEKKRAEKLVAILNKNGFKDNEVKNLKNNVIWTVGNKNAKKTILISAHIDEVGKNKNIKFDNNRIYGSGVWDNCASVIIAVYLSIFIRDNFKYKNTKIVFAATSREEGIGKLGGIKFVVNYLKDISCGIVLDGPYSFVANRTLFLRRYIVKFEGEGGHSANSNSSNNLIIQGANLINDINNEINKINKDIRLNFSNILSNNSNINEIPKSLIIKFEVRNNFNDEKIDDIIQNIMVSKYNIQLKCIDKRQVLELKESSIIYDALNKIEEMGFTNNYVQVNSELDYLLLKKIDSIAMGVAAGGNAHMDNEFLEINSLRIGIKKIYFLLKYICCIYEVDNK